MWLVPFIWLVGWSVGSLVDAISFSQKEEDKTNGKKDKPQEPKL
jgi:hypothetical protein